MSKQASTVKSYQDLVRDLKRLIKTATYHSDEIVRIKHQIGRRILREKGDSITELVDRLSDDLEYSERDLWFCVQFVNEFPDLEKFKERYCTSGSVSWHRVHEDILPGINRERHKQELIELSKTIVLPKHGSLQLWLGDFKEECKRIDDESVDLILTDPPYPDIDAYRELGKIAARILKPSSYLCAYTGFYHFLAAANALSESLQYHGKLNIRLATGLATSRIRDRWFWDMSRDVVIFSKGDGREHPYMMSSIEGEKGDKEAHEWAQGESEAEYIIDHLSGFGDLIVDPFAGSCTTLRAARSKTRRVIGIEIDEERYQIGLGSLKDAI